MKRPILTNLFLLCAVIYGSASFSFSQSFIRCPRADIGGYEKEHKEAKKFVSAATTTDFDKTEIYITAKRVVDEDGTPKEELFLKTNIVDSSEKIKSDAVETYQELFPKTSDPTKKDDFIRTIEESLSHPLKATFGDLPEGTDVPNLLANLIGDRAIDSPREFAKAYQNKIKVVLEEEVFSFPAFRNLDLGNAKHLFCIGRDRLARPMIALNTTKGDIEYLVNIAQIESSPVYARLSNKSYVNMAAKLQAVPFHPADVKLISLVVDEATDNLMLTKIPEQNRVKFDAKKSSRSVFETNLRSSKGKTVYVLSHIEDDRMVTRDRRGKVVFTMAVADLKSFAQAEGITVGLIGCNAAAVDPIGAIANKTIKSTTAVKRFAEALSASNYYDFFRKFSGEDLSLVVSEVTVNTAARSMTTSAELVTVKTSAVTGAILLQKEGIFWLLALASAELQASPTPQPIKVTTLREGEPRAKQVSFDP